MDQRRFEQTFRHIVSKLNNIGPDAKKPADLRPVRIPNERHINASSTPQRTPRTKG